MLDLVLTNAEQQFIKEIKIGDTLACSKDALFEFTISRNLGLMKTRVRTLNFRRANFWLFKESLDEMPWEAVLRGRNRAELATL